MKEIKSFFLPYSSRSERRKKKRKKRKKLFFPQKEKGNSLDLDTSTKILQAKIKKKNVIEQYGEKRKSAKKVALFGFFNLFELSVCNNVRREKRQVFFVFDSSKKKCKKC